MGKTYNRIEGDKRKVGDIITRSGPPALHNNYPKVEEILERNRPASCVPRGESVNMRPDRDFKAMGIDKFDYGYVHQVEPIDPVEVRDIEWIGALQARYPKSGVRLPEKYPGVSDDELAQRYWRGELSKKPRTEYATRSAKVLSVEDELTRVNGPHEMEDALKKVAEYGKTPPTKSKRRGGACTAM